MKKFKIAAILMIFHGGVIEVGGCLALLISMLYANASITSQHFFSFIVPYLQDNLELMIALGGVFGITRIVGAVGLWKNRIWGLMISVINCIVTMMLMIFMLPAGIFDGILTCSSLVLILTGYYGKKDVTLCCLKKEQNQ